MTIPEMEGGKIEKKIKARVIHKKKITIKRNEI